MSEQGGSAAVQAGLLADKYRSWPEEKAANAVAAQLRMFWDPHMIKGLHTAAARGQLTDPVVLRALTLL